MDDEALNDEEVELYVDNVVDEILQPEDGVDQNKKVEVAYEDGEVQTVD